MADEMLWRALEGATSRIPLETAVPAAGSVIAIDGHALLTDCIRDPGTSLELGLGAPTDGYKSSTQRCLSSPLTRCLNLVVRGDFDKLTSLLKKLAFLQYKPVVYFDGPRSPPVSSHILKVQGTEPVLRSTAGAHLQTMHYDEARRVFATDMAGIFSENRYKACYEWLKERRWEVFYAPGEAVVQLAGMSLRGEAAAVWSNNPALVLLGATKILRTLDRENEALFYSKDLLHRTDLGQTTEFSRMALLFVLPNEWGAPFGDLSVSDALLLVSSQPSFDELLQHAEMIGARLDADNKLAALFGQAFWDHHDEVIRVFGDSPCFASFRPQGLPLLPLPTSDDYKQRRNQRAPHSLISDRMTYSDFAGMFYYMAIECYDDGHRHSIQWYRTGRLFYEAGTTAPVTLGSFDFLGLTKKTREAAIDLLKYREYTCSHGTTYIFPYAGTM